MNFWSKSSSNQISAGAMADDEWGKTVQIQRNITLLDDGSQQIVDDPRMGIFSIETRLITKERKPYEYDYEYEYEESRPFYRLKMKHFSACKVKIEFTWYNCHPLGRCKRDYVEIDGRHPQQTTLIECEELSQSFKSGNFLISLQMGLNCPCRTCALRSSYERLFLSSESTDVIFQIGDVEIPAHKLVLTARYEYFQTMFSSGMKESETNRIQIKGVEPKFFREVLRFIYGGNLPKDFDKDVAIYLPIAEQYGFEDLKSACFEQLEKSLTSTNAVEYIAIAVKYRLDDLTAVGCELLKKNLTSENVAEALLLSHNHEFPTLKNACFEAIKELKARGKMEDGAFEPLHEHPKLMAETICKT